jgi:N-methylhydantoinase B/oxoprolinase/acetone carboxylase alpha subunit
VSARVTAAAVALARAVAWPAEPVVGIGDAHARPLLVSDPLRSPSLAATGAHLVGFFAGDLRTGDVLISNDPFSGASHVTEFTLVRAAERGTTIIRMRLPDVGGFELGGLAPQSFDTWGEGARFPALRIGVEARPRTSALDILTLNSRTPALLRRGLEAMEATATELAAALDAGELSVEDGRATAAAAAAAALAALSAGTHRGEAEVEWRGDDGPPVVRAELMIGGGRPRLSLAASDPQLEAPVNSPAPHTLDCCLGALADAVDGFPAAPGALDALDIDPGSGTITGALAPAITGLAPHLTARAIRRAVGTALRDAGAPVEDADAWWWTTGAAAYADRVDANTFRLPERQAQALVDLERESSR